MRRASLGALAGFLATLAAFLVFWLQGEPGPRRIAWGVALGGVLGSLLAGASCGAQVAFVRHRPASNASFAAMVSGFAAKALALAVGILLLRGSDAPADPVGYGVALVGASVVTAAVVLPALL
jgi:hypothetical protein